MAPCVLSDLIPRTPLTGKKSIPVKREAEDLLFRWGRWSRDNPGLKFSSCSTLGRVIEEGPGAGQVSRGTQIPMPEPIELCEQIVLSMPSDLQDAIIAKYVHRLRDMDASKSIHHGITQYRVLVMNGVMWTAGYLARHSEKL